ncbi:MAG: hypothetical protein FD546_000223 [Pelagibacterales bacterium]|nr:hypothetical protein [Pelagibacterales bacterium]
MKTLKKINIIYICISEKGPSGGGKIIYNHSEVISNLKNTFTSQILHIKKKKLKKLSGSIKKIFKSNKPKYTGWNVKDIKVNQNYKSEWFNNNVSIKNDFEFDPKKDFVIVPEIFSHFANELLIKKKIPYAIFAQNGYTLKTTNDYKTLNTVYKKAKFILSYSKDITNCVLLAFPFCSKKIQEISYSINENDFDLSKSKKNLITYMPRKLSDHAEQLLFFLKNNLPKNWKIESIHNMKQKDVYRHLVQSKIFLSFSRLEGLPLPPVEAAIAKNKVIGYTGEGGKQYWKEPVFTEIPNGDFSKFTTKILENIRNEKKGKKFNLVRKKIIKDFSINREIKNIKLMLKKISNYY